MKYLSTFSGIGGFELGIQNILPDAKCVGFSEIDKFAPKVYKHHFPNHKEYGDIKKIATDTLPDFDCLVGGFPCQSFSIAGKRGGFKDTRGTLFFELARILRDKKPRCFVFENVKGLLSHDEGNTFKTIIATLDELGYFVEWQVRDSENFGVPQGRERVFIVGHFGGEPKRKVFPLPKTTDKNSKKLSSTAIDANYWKGIDNHGARTAIIQLPRGMNKGGIKYTCPTISSNSFQHNNFVCVPVLTPNRTEKRQNGRRFKNDGEASFTLTAQDRHGVFNGIRIRLLTPLECERLQGFPDNWTNVEKMSDSQRYKQLGNAVTVNVIEAIFKKIYQP